MARPAPRWIVARGGSGAAVALLAALAGPAAPPATAQTPAPAFPASTDAVTVDVIVLDGAGHPVSGLTRDEFAVAEDGAAQTLTAFDAIQISAVPAETVAAVPVEVVRPAVSTNARPARPARSIVIVFDDTHITPIRADAAREAIRQFLVKGAGPGDRVTLAATSGGDWWTTTLPEGAPDLAAALARLKGLRLRDASAAQISDYEALRIARYRDETVRNQVFTRLMELDQLGDPDSGKINGGALAKLNLPSGRSMIEMMAAQVLGTAEARMRVTLALLERVVASLAGPRGHKTVLLVSEGFVTDPQIAEYARLARRAAEANAEIDFVDARSLAADLPAMADAEIARVGNDTKALNILQRARLETEGAETVALDSGGLVLRGGNNLAGALARATAESRAYYLLGYQSTNRARDGKFRHIHVTVSRPGLTVRARKGYYAPRAEGEPAPVRPAGLEPDVQRALDAPEPAADIPLRLADYRLGPGTASGKTKVRLTAELDPAALAFRANGDRSRDQVETFFVVASRDTGGGESHRAALDLDLPADALAHLRATWLPLQRDYDLSPGVYQARLAVRDGNAGRVASVRHEFAVPPPDAFGFLTPVLTDTVIAPAHEGEPARPALVARRTFAAGSRLYCQFEVTGAASEAGGAPHVRAGHLLRRLDGTVLAHLDPTPMPPGPDGRVTRLLAISLRAAQPGEHELVLTAHDDASGRDVETHERFLVAAPEEAAPTSLPSVPRDVEGYRSLVQRYAAGDRDAAALDLAGWPSPRLKDIARTPPAALIQGTAAVDGALLLTDAALRRGADEDDALAAARRLLEAEGDSAEARDRRRRWALALSSHFLAQSRLDAARRWAEDARRLDAGDPASLLALGIVTEMEATLGDPRGAARPAAARAAEVAPIGSESLPAFLGQGERDRKARDAEELYASALARDPALAEAHLRRGRLLARRGRTAESAADLAWVVDHAEDARLRAVAHLLLARADDAAGARDSALRHYDAALALAPRTLSATVGRSDLLSRMGRGALAAQSVTSTLSEAGGGAEPLDPWLAYHLGFARPAAEMLAALRPAGHP